MFQWKVLLLFSKMCCIILTWGKKEYLIFTHSIWLVPFFSYFSYQVQIISVRLSYIRPYVPAPACFFFFTAGPRPGLCT